MTSVCRAGFCVALFYGSYVTVWGRYQHTLAVRPICRCWVVHVLVCLVDLLYEVVFDRLVMPIRAMVLRCVVR